jgi:hypothetical protein
MFPVGMETKGPPRFTLTGYLKPVDKVALLPRRHDSDLLLEGAEYLGIMRLWSF